MDKEQQAISRLIQAANDSERFYHAPLVVTTSGGKDSAVLVQLALNAGIDFELMHSHTTADAPETVRFLRQEFKRLESLGLPHNQMTVNYPTYKGKRVTMWSLIPQKLMPPTRLMRYCCAILKETAGGGRYIATGVRWAESVGRRKNRGIYEAGRGTIIDSDNDIIMQDDNEKSRRFFETCSVQGKAVVNPIVDWTDRDVWDYIRDQKIPVNPLYECGFRRVGCIGCPLASKHGREREFARWPGYKKLYLWAFGKMLEERRRRGKMQGTFNMGTTPEDVFHWWMEDGFISGQEVLDGF